MALTAADLVQLEINIDAAQDWVEGDETTDITAANGRQSKSIAKINKEAETALQGQVLLPPVAWSIGLLIDSIYKTVTNGGIIYAPRTNLVPFTTGGTFNSANWYVTQGLTNLTGLLLSGGTMTGDITTSTALSVNDAVAGAIDGNIGLDVQTLLTVDLNTLTKSGFFYVASTSANVPITDTGSLIVGGLAADRATQVFAAISTDRVFFRRKLAGAWSAWQEFYHTGNMGVFDVLDSNAPGAEKINFHPTLSRIRMIGVGTSTTAFQFINDNGTVGSISTSGTATAYNTSSDPRLKDFKGQPLDADINAQFDLLFSCFDTFNWKNDPDGDLVWGFDAHAVIDAGLDIGSEGEGSRELALGEAYQEQVVDDNGDEVTPELKVTPAGVDQSKAVPILLAKIEQLERRLAVLEA